MFGNVIYIQHKTSCLQPKHNRDFGARMVETVYFHWFFSVTPVNACVKYTVKTLSFVLWRKLQFLCIILPLNNLCNWKCIIVHTLSNLRAKTEHRNYLYLNTECYHPTMMSRKILNTKGWHCRISRTSPHMDLILGIN